MVVRLPTAKRTAGTPPAVLPRRRATRSTSAFPLLPALAATLVLLGVGQAGLWWWNTRLPGGAQYLKTSITRTVTPETTPRVAAAMPTSTRLRVETLPQNVQFGDAMGRVRLTIFTDPACGSCRERVHELTAGLPVQGLRQVYKFWPQESARTTPGLLVELARREAVIPTFWKNLQAQEDRDLSDVELLQLLERSGLPLDTQRAALSQNTAELYDALSADLKVAREANLPPPPVLVIDDHVIEARRVTQSQLREMIKYRMEGRQLGRENELWMMNR